MNYSEVALGGSYLKAKQSAFAFTAAEKTFNGCLQRQETIIKGLGDKKPSSYQIVISVIVIFLSFILCGAEASNCQQSMQGIGGFSETTALLMGIAASAIGLLSGHLIQKGIQKDEFSGARTYTWQFYFGGLLGLTYIGFQFFLSKSAGAGDSSMLFFNIYVVIICLLTIFVGFMLQSSIQTIAYLVAGLWQKIAYRKMWKAAKQTDYYWLRYIYEISNAHSPATQAEESISVKRAREFYNSGGTVSADDETTYNPSLS